MEGKKGALKRRPAGEGEGGGCEPPPSLILCPTPCSQAGWGEPVPEPPLWDQGRHLPPEQGAGQPRQPVAFRLDSREDFPPKAVGKPGEDSGEVAGRALSRAWGHSWYSHGTQVFLEEDLLRPGHALTLQKLGA